MYKLGKFEMPDPTDPRWEANKPLPDENPVFTCGPVTVSKESGLNCVKVGGIDLANCDPELRMVPYNEYARQVTEYVEKRIFEADLNQVTQLLAEFNQM